MRSMVEGAQPPTLAHDTANNALQISKHLTRRNPKHRKSKPLKIAIPLTIPLLPCCAIMSVAVHFNPKPHLQTSEVDRKSTLRALLAEAESPWPLFERPPQKALGGAHVPPQPAGELDRLDRYTEDARAPSTSLRLVPLPVPGRSA